MLQSELNLHAQAMTWGGWTHSGVTDVSSLLTSLGTQLAIREVFKLRCLPTSHTEVGSVLLPCKQTFTLPKDILLQYCSRCLSSLILGILCCQ